MKQPKRYTKRQIIREINSHTAVPTISQLLENNGLDIRELYKYGYCWSTLKREAGRLSYTDDKVTKRLEKGIYNLLHHNSVSFLHFVNKFILGEQVHLEATNRIYALMLYYVLFQEPRKTIGFSSINEALELIHKPQYACFKQELTEVVSYLLSNSEPKTEPIYPDLIPGLELYGCYTRGEIFTLVGEQTEDKKKDVSFSGVFDLPKYNTILLFVTLNKTEKNFTPSTLYHDYLIDDRHFHWQSQNKDSHNNNGGRRYTEQAQKDRKIILFVRKETKDDFGRTAPFHCFGLVDYISSSSDFPMNVIWKLHSPAMALYRNMDQCSDLPMSTKRQI